MSGMLGDRASEYYTVKDQIEEKAKSMSFAEYRFSDIGKSLTAYGKARDAAMSEEYGFLERQVGTAWEKLVHTRSFVGLKFLNAQSPLEAYERQSIYGKEMKMWETPISDYVGSHMYLIAGETRPIQGAITGGITGLMFGGTPYGALLGAVGATFATYNKLTGHTFIPQRVQDRREVVNQLDAVKYAKLNMMYQETGDMKYQQQASRTITGAAINGEVLDPRMVGFPLNTPERNYIQDIINNVTTENMDRVAAVLPSPAVASMYAAIGRPEQATGIMQRVREEQLNRFIPGADSPIYSPDMPLSSPMITTMEMKGLVAHDAGYGWYDQQAALARGRLAGLYNGETIYPGEYESKVTVKDFSVSVNSDNQIRAMLGRYAKNIMMYQDGSDRIELEVIANDV